MPARRHRAALEWTRRISRKRGRPEGRAKSREETPKEGSSIYALRRSAILISVSFRVIDLRYRRKALDFSMRSREPEMMLDAANDNVRSRMRSIAITVPVMGFLFAGLSALLWR